MQELLTNAYYGTVYSLEVLRAVHVWCIWWRVLTLLILFQDVSSALFIAAFNEHSLIIGTLLRDFPHIDSVINNIKVSLVQVYWYYISLVQVCLPIVNTQHT